MRATHEQTIDTIHDLIETCRDGARGYRTASQDTKDRELNALFNGFAAEREKFAEQLQARARALGDDGKESGSATATLHRGWINIRAAVATNEPHAILEECERGEDAAVETYQKALRSDSLDGETAVLVGEQFEAVVSAHDRIKDLRDGPLFRKKAKE